MTWSFLRHAVHLILNRRTEPRMSGVSYPYGKAAPIAWYHARQFLEVSIGPESLW